MRQAVKVLEIEEMLPGTPKAYHVKLKATGKFVALSRKLTQLAAGRVVIPIWLAEKVTDGKAQKPVS